MPGKHLLLRTPLLGRLVVRRGRGLASGNSARAATLPHSVCLSTSTAPTALANPAAAAVANVEKEKVGAAAGAGAGAAATATAGADGGDDAEWSWKWKLFGVVAATTAVGSVPVFVARSMNQDDIFELEVQERAPQVASALEPIRPYVGGTLSSLDEWDPRYVGCGWQREERYGWGAITGSEHAVVVRTMNGEAVVPNVTSEERMPDVLERAGLRSDEIVVDVRVS